MTGRRDPHLQQVPQCDAAAAEQMEREDDSNGEETKAAQVPLLVASLIVFILASWLQERVSRSPEFDGPLLVLGETGAYVCGGLLFAAFDGGWAGIRNCVSPSRYLVFLPASLGFMTVNFCQYPSLRVFGAVNHSLLSQLNLVLMAFLLWAWKGRQVSLVQWAALLHLALGLLLLVALTAEYDAPSQGQQSGLGDFGLAVAAVTTCIAASSFANIYLEGALRTQADTIFVQMHQMNAVQATVALLLFLRGLQHESGPHSSVGALTLVFLALAITRGTLIGLVLKYAGSLANGALGVASIVGVAVLQLTVEGRQVTGLGLQATILLSVANYLVADGRGKGTRSEGAGCSPGGPIGSALQSINFPVCLQVCLLVSLLAFVPYNGRPPFGPTVGELPQIPHE